MEELDTTTVPTEWTDKDTAIIKEYEQDVADGKMSFKELEMPEPIDIGLKQLKGLGDKTVEKLANFGITSLYDLGIRGAREIEELTGADKNTAQNWVLLAKAKLEEAGLVRSTQMDVLELLEYQEQIKKITIGVEGMDKLLGGGLSPEALYEFYGEFGSGKTQYCLTAVANVLANGGHAVWFDCEDTFKPMRLVQILVARGLVADEDEAKGLLKNLTYRHTPNTEDYEKEEGLLTSLLVENPTQLIIMDGVIGQYAEEYIGRGTLSVRQNKLRRVMTHLKNICYYFKCTVIFTNQVQTDPSIMFGDPTKPIGGNVVAHASTYRIYFKKQGKKRIARMVDSPKDDILEFQYALTEKGIDDVE